jgi:hypothetical protein
VPLLTGVDSAPLRNRKPVQPIDRQRGFMWDDGHKRSTPDALELLTAVMPALTLKG